MNNNKCIETNRSMSRTERDAILASNTTPNSEQIAFAHNRSLNMTGATAAEKRAHVAGCVACSTWKAAK